MARVPVGETACCGDFGVWCDPGCRGGTLYYWCTQSTPHARVQFILRPALSPAHTISPQSPLPGARKLCIRSLAAANARPRSSPSFSTPSAGPRSGASEGEPGTPVVTSADTLGTALVVAVRTLFWKASSSARTGRPASERIQIRRTSAAECSRASSSSACASAWVPCACNNACTATSPSATSSADAGAEERVVAGVAGVVFAPVPVATAVDGS